jgi:hypothetical protein
MKDYSRTTGRPLVLPQDTPGGDSVQSPDYTVNSTKDDGGLVLTNIEVVVVFWGSFWSKTSPPPSPNSDTYYKAFVGVVTGPYMTRLRQYRGVQPGTMLGKFINDTAPDPVDKYSDQNVSDMLVKLFQSNSNVPAPVDGHSRFYAVITPPGINNALTYAPPPQGPLAGQHQTFTYPPNGITSFYAWVDTDGTLEGSNGAIKVFSHELVEAATDPNVSTQIGEGGIFVEGTQANGKPVNDDEIGDTCNSRVAIVQMNGVQCSVQCYWSAADKACVLPLGTLSFLVNKNSFGLGEVKEAIKKTGGAFGGAFWVALDDFSINTFNSFGVQVPVPTGPFANVQGVSIKLSAATTANPNPVYEDPNNPTLIQRIRFSYDVIFASPLTTPFPASGTAQYSLTTTFSTNGVTVPGPGSSDTINFELVTGGDPYFSNIDPFERNAVFWLSRDLRVFSLTRGQSALPGNAAAPTFDNVMSPYDYVQALLGYLNTTTTFTAPGPLGSPDPLDSLPQQTGAETGESSVTPFDPSGQPNFNFAIARVRLTSDTQGSASAATDVRVFFRLWIAASFDTDFEPNTTYLSTPAFPALPTAPLASSANLPLDPTGASIRTTPFFATKNGSGDYDHNVSNNNIRTLQIPVVAGQDTVWGYYGAFLDVYNANNQTTYPGTHHCLVAQIAFDGSPIPFDPNIATSPGNSDKLAQRNLQVISSGNPGPKPTHRIPQTFDTRPSPGPTFGTGGVMLNFPDELMVDWGQVPKGTRAHIFWPDVLASDIVALSARLYGPGRLTAEDANTIAFDAVPGGATYIPIPTVPATATTTIHTFAGLFTVDLPLGVQRGQEFNILVRRLTTQFVPDIPVPTTVAAAAAGPKSALAADVSSKWRAATGTFQVKIPVTTERMMLGPEINTLAIMKARLQAMAKEYRWMRVIERYVDYISARVDGAGGNAAGVLPSLNGSPPKHRCDDDDGDGDDDKQHGCLEIVIRPRKCIIL